MWNVKIITDAWISALNERWFLVSESYDGDGYMNVRINLLRINILDIT